MIARARRPAEANASEPTRRGGERERESVNNSLWQALALRGSGPGPIQRACAACEEQEDPAVQRMPESQGADAQGALWNVSEAVAGQGRPLPSAIREPMSERVGFPLDHVRVHTGSTAADSAAALRARAYTVGSNIVFGAGNYQPSTRAGQRLIAHEVAHTLQQRSGRVSMKRGEVSSPRDPLEAEADQFAAAMVDGGSMPPRFASASPPPANGENASPDGASRLSDAPIQRDGEEDARRPSRFDEAIDTIRSTARWVPGLQQLVASIDIIRAAYDLYQRRDEIFRQIVDGMDEYIQRIPGEAQRLAQEHAATLGPEAADAFMCIFGEMGAFLESLAENWRDVAESILRDMLIVPLLARAIPTIIENVEGIADDIGSGEFGSAVDRAVNIMTEVNSIAGVLFLWYALVLTVFGTTVGTVEPGGGNAAGAAAGVTISEILGVVLLSSVVTTELTRVVRGLQLMSEHWDDINERRAACREVAEGIFGLALTAVLFFIGPYVQRFARAIITRARAFAAEVAAGADAGLRRLATPPALAAGPNGQVMPFSRGTPEPLRPVVEPVGPARPRVPRGSNPRPVAPGEAPVQAPAPSPSPAASPTPAPTPGTRTAGALGTDPLRRVDGEEDEDGDSTPCDAMGLRQEYPRPPSYRLMSDDYTVTMRPRASPNYTYKKPISITARVRRGSGGDSSGVTRSIMQGSTRRVEDASGQFVCRKVGVNSNETVGHIIGRYFRGQANDQGLAMGNIFPQEANSNGTVYNAIEQRIQALIGNRTACMRLTFFYGDADYPVRPVGFRVEYWVEIDTNGNHEHGDQQVANPHPA